MAKKSATATAKETTVEDKLEALYALQLIDSTIDKIRTIRGELPLEVQDLEDEIVGLETRIAKFTEEMESLQTEIGDKKNHIKECLAMIKKYEAQQMNVRNNREFDSISKEIEFQNLEIQLAEKKMKEAEVTIENKKEIIAESAEKLSERKKDLEHKQKELKEITSETQKEETDLVKKSEKAEEIIEDRLITAYKRIRENAVNGLAVVTVERDSCGGCFNKIPPQRQMDIKTHKKIIVCEHCGRILVDPEMAAAADGTAPKETAAAVIEEKAAPKAASKKPAAKEEKSAAKTTAKKTSTAAAKKPAAKKAATKKPAEKKAAAKKPAAKKTAAKKPATKKPAAKKATSKK